MKRAVFFTGRKGGTGKTKIARLLAEIHRSRKTGPVLVDADCGVGQFLKHLGMRDTDGRLLNPQPSPIEGGVVAIDWHADTESRAALAEVLAYGRPTIVDLPGGSLDDFRMLDRNAGYLDVVRDMGIAATFVSPVTPWVETWADALAIRDWAPSVAHVLAVNHDFGTDDDFVDWVTSETRSKLLASGSREIGLPLLPSGIAARIAKHRLTFHGAIKSDRLLIMDRGWVQRWLARATAAIDEAGDLLGLDPTTRGEQS